MRTRERKGGFGIAKCRGAERKSREVEADTGSSEWGASGGLPPTSPLCFPFSSFSFFPRARKDVKEGDEMPLDWWAVLELLLKKGLGPQTPSYYVLLCCHLLKSLNSNAASFSVWRLPVRTGPRLPLRLMFPLSFQPTHITYLTALRSVV